MVRCGPRRVLPTLPRRAMWLSTPRPCGFPIRPVLPPVKVCLPPPLPPTPGPIRLYHADAAHMRASAQLIDDGSKECEHITVVGGVANVMLVVFKGIGGYLGNSTAMMADAANSLSDLFGDAISYLAIREARKPPDATHPFGHGKYESIAAFGIAGLLMFTAAETAKGSIAAVAAVSAAGAGAAMGPTAIAAVAAVVSILTKEVLYRVCLRIGERARSQATVANAHHHRSDALTSLVALAGIGGAQLGWAICDPLAGAVVSLFIARAGWKIGLDAFHDLVDTAVDPKDLGVSRCLDELMPQLPGVAKYDYVRARKSGPFVAVSFHLHVEPGMSVTRAHDVQHAIRLELAKIEGVR
eukprot:EG_transcript_16484